ncbi:hypothetical protein ACMEOK_07395 [Lactiplantibacillus plantarum]|uniref:hypothetical protein n=1 Tax=Lactiplantibacillus TaxID=2767842 RepID=UPI001F3714C8|nr:hypothetical protein [Lactiplantibacillus plantarum]
MWFSRHQKRNSLQAPVAGTYTAIPTATSPQQIGLLAIQPTSPVINAPIDGDIISLSPSRLVINSLSNQHIELRIDRRTSTTTVPGKYAWAIPFHH